MAVGAGGGVEVALDWKSDVTPTDAVIAGHTAQLRAYLQVTGAARGGTLVYLTLGNVRWIEVHQ